MSINPSKEMAKMMKIMEDGYLGKSDGSDVDYETSSSGDKVTATVKGHLSARYTKLAKNIDRIKQLQAELDETVAQTKQDARDAISDLFAAEDEVRTRVVETVSFTLKLTRTPDPTTTVKYAKVLSELEKSLTPELIQVLEGLKQKFSSTVQKSAALSFAPKESAGISEGPLDKMSAFFAKFLSYIDNWCSKYDMKLAKLQSQVGMGEGIIENDANDSEESFAESVKSSLTNAGITVTRMDEGTISCLDNDDNRFTITIKRS